MTVLEKKKPILDRKAMCIPSFIRNIHTKVVIFGHSQFSNINVLVKFKGLLSSVVIFMHWPNCYKTKP